MQYQLLDEGKVSEKQKPTNGFIRLIKRFKLPDPIDKIGEKKLKIEKIHLLLLIIAVIAIIIYVIVHDVESFPKLSTAVKYDNSTRARMVVCSFDQKSKFTLERVLIAWGPSFTSHCNFTRGATNIDNCEDLVLYDSSINCLIFGSNSSRWSIPHTAIPAVFIRFDVSRNINEFVEGSELYFFYLLENDNNEPWKDLLSFQESVSDFVRAGYVYSVGFTQQVRKAYGRDDTRAFKTNILNMGLLTGHNATAVENEISLPITFWLHLRSNITEVISEQTPTELVFSMLSGIGGFASTASTVLTVMFSVLLTRLLFKDRDAFFKEETRLAATYFTKQSNVPLQ